MSTTGNLKVLKYRSGQFLETEVIFDEPEQEPGQGQGPDGGQVFAMYKKVRMIKTKLVRRPTWVPKSSFR